MKINSILIYAEINDSKIDPVFYELLSKVQELSVNNKTTVSCILLGSNLDSPLTEIKESGVDQVMLLDDERLAIYNVDYYREVISNAVLKFDPDLLLFGATAIGEELAPTMGQRLKTGVAAHCMDIRINEKGKLSQMVPAFGGKVLGEIFTPLTRPQIVSIKPGILSVKPLKPNQKCRIFNLDRNILDNTPTSIEAVSINTELSQGISIDKAEFIVCAGYGVASSDISKDLATLSKLLNGAVGYTRAAIDVGMADNQNTMIGTSGKSVRPKIYLGVGISGSTHHICGMKDSDVIISINTDPDSEIFNVSDYKVIADGPSVIKELVDVLISNVSV